MTTSTLGSFLYLFKGDTGFVYYRNIVILPIEAQGILQPPEITQVLQQSGVSSHPSASHHSGSVLEMGPGVMCGNSALCVCSWCLTWQPWSLTGSLLSR